MSPIIDVSVTGAIRPKRGLTTPELVKGLPHKPGKAPPGFDHPLGAGMIVVFSRIPGLTGRNVLSEPFVFQCPPLDSFAPQFAWSFDDYATVSGFHTNPQYPQLTAITFETLIVDARFPTPTSIDRNYPFIVARVDNPLEAVRQLKRLGESMTPFQIQAGQPRLWGEWETLGRGDQAALAVTMRSLTPTERAFEPDSRYLSVSLVEFPDAPRLSSLVQPPPLMPGSGHRQGGSITTPSGLELEAELDPTTLPAGRRTLYELSKHYYQSTSEWRLIAKASGLTGIGPGDDLRESPSAKRQPPAKILIPVRASSTAAKEVWG